jgi:hypothetical protein
MTTAGDMALRVAREVMDVMDGTATTGAANSLTDTNGLRQPNQYWDIGTLFIRSGTHSGKVAGITGHYGNKLTFDTLGSVICVHQVETATVVGSVTGGGNATVVVTAAGMLNSPKTVSVAVLNLDTASAVGGKIRTALGADADISNFFTIGGSGAAVSLTHKNALANDTTLNISIDNGTCTGLTAAPTSANTTAGVAGPRYAVARGDYPFWQMLAAINQALDETHVTSTDHSLAGDGETLDFTLPAGVSDIKRVHFKRDDMYLYSTHWQEYSGVLRFDYGYAPSDDDEIYIDCRSKHSALSVYSDTISDEISVDWLKWKAAEHLLWWGLQVYGGQQEYRIEERMNKVLQNLKGKTPRRDGPDIVVRTARSIYL